MFPFLYHWQEFYRTWLNIWVTRRLSYKKQELRTLCEHMGSPLFLVGPVLLIFLVFCDEFLRFVCLRPVCCEPNVDSGFGLSILDCTFGFLLRLFIQTFVNDNESPNYSQHFQALGIFIKINYRNVNYFELKNYKQHILLETSHELPLYILL